MRDLLAAAFVVLIAGTPALAQDTPVGFNFGGGVAFPVTGLNDAFNTGWNGNLGLTWNITPEVGILGEYMYDRLGGPDRSFDFSATPIPGAGTQSGIIESNHQVHTGTFNLVYTPRLAANERAVPIGVYALGGGGIYHRLIQLTTPSVGYASVPSTSSRSRQPRNHSRTHSRPFMSSSTVLSSVCSWSRTMRPSSRV